MSDHSSRLVLALDLENGAPGALLRKGRGLLEETLPYTCAIRFGRQTILNLGIPGTTELVMKIHEEGLACIIDDKLCDIGSTNAAITKAYYDIMGFDGIIVNPTSGWEGGLEPVFELSSKEGKGVIVLAYMSHPGAKESFGQRVLTPGTNRIRYQYQVFTEKAVKWGADGVVVGATRPAIVREVKQMLDGRIPVYSPGIGAQGGSLSKARQAGTEYFIVGRTVTTSAEPGQTAAKLARESIGN